METTKVLPWSTLSSAYLAAETRAYLRYYPRGIFGGNLALGQVLPYEYFVSG